VRLAVSCGRDPDFLDDVAAYAARGLPVTRVAMRRGIAPVADAVSLCRLILCVRRMRPDLIHAHSSKAGFLARLAGRVCGVPVIYTPHALPFLMACGSRKLRFYRFLEKRMRDATATLIAVSEEERQAALALGYGERRVYFIPNGVARCDSRPVTIRANGVLRVGFFGRLTRQKGPDVLLEAVADVVAHMPQVHFSFYGAGPMADDLRKQAEERQLASHVHFHGAYRQDEAAARMRQVDVVAVPSRWEGCPYVVLEAFAAGVPVVAAAVGGVPDLIRDGVNGVCVAANDPEALCDGLLDVLRDPQKRRQLAEQGLVTAETRSIAAMAAAVEKVYRQVSTARR